MAEELMQHVGEAALTGDIVEAGPDHLVVRDMATTDEITVRIDDTTHYTWSDPAEQGRLTDSARVRVGYYIAGGIHKAREVHVLDPGDGESIGDRIVNVIH